MNNETLKPINSPKTLQDKSFFASYINMARHNAYIVLSHITEVLGYTPSAEDQLAEMRCVTILSSVEKPEQSQKSIKLLREHFPFLKFYYDAEVKRLENDEEKIDIDERQLYFSILTKLLKEFNKFRNEFTHAKTIDIDFTNRRHFFFDMERIFEIAVRKIIDIRNFKEEDVEHLRKFSGSTKVNDKFTPKPNPNFKHQFLNEEKTNYTEAGLAFVIGLFLEKSYAYKFLKQLKGFKAGNTPSYRATSEAFSIFHIRLPKQRINHIVSSSQSLALDMFNELKKCPKILFNLLSDEDKEKFRIEKTSETEELTEDLAEDFNLVRSNDRFSFFALQYIDHNKLFQNLRFQVDMGNYFHKVYTKNGVDSEDRIRRLKKNIKTFGRLQDLNETRLELWENFIKDKPKLEDTALYVTDTTPHYHIELNNIGIKLTPTQLPHLPQQPPPVNQKPDFWLSAYELPAVMFLLLLEDNPNKISLVESLLLDYRKRTQTFLNDLENIKIKQFTTKQLEQYLLDTYKFKIKDVSPEILQYLQNKEPIKSLNASFEEYAIKKLSQLEAESNRMLKRLEEDIAWKGLGKKPGKKGWKEIKSGELADFLVKDILWLQPSLDGMGKDKVTGQNFQILQASIAFYGRDKHLLANIFKQCKLTDSPNAHPFLKDIDLDKHNDIVSFYDIYLYKRAKYFEQCLQEKKYSNYYFLRPQSDKWNNPFNKFDKKNICERIIKNTLNVPRGFFKNALLNWCKHNGTLGMQQVANKDRTNTIYIIQKYFELERSNDNNQEFYKYERNYKVINKLYNQRKNNNQFNPLIKKFFDTSSIEFNKVLKEIAPIQIEKMPVPKGKLLKDAQAKMKLDISHLKQTEKQIRLIKVEDMLLFLMAKKTLFENVSKTVQLKMADEVFQLKNIKPQAGDISDTTLSLQLPFELIYRVNKMDDTNQVKLEQLHTITIHQQNLKAKNYGDFVKFTKDRRLNNLFSWLPANTRVERSTLQKELDNYDTIRLRVFEIIQQFEMLVLQKLGIRQDEKDSTVKYKSFNDILTTFYTTYPAYLKEQEMAKQIRNAFSHNQYPMQTIFNTEDNLILPNVANYIATISNTMFSNYCQLLNN